MYWSVIGFLSAFEYVAEWLVSWIPLYYFFKTLFLLFLALPQTQGSTFVYSVHLAPILREHEDQIDSAVTQIKLAAYEFIQDKLRAVWNQVLGGTVNAAAPQAAPNVAAVNPPSMADPLSGAAQMVSGWWSAYAPAVIATGAAYIASSKQAAEAAVRQQRLRKSAQNADAEPAAQSSTDPRSSLQARRRALEAELAALPPSFPVAATPVSDSFAGDSTSRSSASSVSTNVGDTRRRKESGSDEDAGKYETIGREDVGGSEGSPQPRSSWWWRASSYQGYERVKSE